MSKLESSLLIFNGISNMIIKIKKDFPLVPAGLSEGIKFILINYLQIEIVKFLDEASRFFSLKKEDGRIKTIQKIVQPFYGIIHEEGEKIRILRNKVLTHTRDKDRPEEFVPPNLIAYEEEIINSYEGIWVVAFCILNWINKVKFFFQEEMQSAINKVSKFYEENPEVFQSTRTLKSTRTIEDINIVIGKISKEVEEIAKKYGVHFGKDSKI